MGCFNVSEPRGGTWTYKYDLDMGGLWLYDKLEIIEESRRNA